jgi:hypothetical protein
MNRRELVLGGSAALPAGRNSFGYGGPTNIVTVPNVDALMDLHPNGETAVFVAGYDRRGDGGGGAFVWVDQDSRGDQGLIFRSRIRGSWRRVEASGPVRVEWFGAKGDGETDDTAALQRALDSSGRHLTIAFGPGKVYSITNVVLPAVDDLTLLGNNSTLKARPGGDAGFLVASRGWIGNSPEAQPPVHIFEMRFDGGGLVDFSVVLQSWNSDFEGCEVRGARDSGVLVTACTRGGVGFPSSTLVNNRIRNCRVFNNGGSGVRVLDPSRSRATDMLIRDCYIFGNKGWGFEADTLGGTQIIGCHLYGNLLGDIRVRYQGVGGLIADSYLESSPSVKVECGGVPLVVRGCWMLGRLQATFEDGPPFVHSSANQYCGKNSFLENGGTSDRNVIYSVNDCYSVDDAFRWTVRDSSGVIYADGVRVGTEASLREGPQQRRL